MISYLSGRLTGKKPTHLVVDVGGVGFRVQIPLSTFEHVGGVGESIKILTHLIVREDSLQLFGFMTEGERSLFELLISVSGVGPQLAQKILSGLSVQDFKRCVVSEDGKGLSAIPGIGKKTAERLVLELRDRIGEVGGVEAQPPGLKPSGVLQEAVLALSALGVTKASAERAVDVVLKQDGDLSLEQVIKQALQKV